MATVIRGDARRAAALSASDPAGLVVQVGGPPPPEGGAPVAHLALSVRDEALGRRIGAAVTRGLRAVSPAPRSIPTVRVRSPRALARLGAEATGKIAVVPVTARNLRALGELVEALRGAGVAGIQLVWDGVDPPRAAAEGPVFAALEQARATPGRAPVVLARGEEPAEALRILVDFRR